MSGTWTRGPPHAPALFVAAPSAPLAGARASPTAAPRRGRCLPPLPRRRRRCPPSRRAKLVATADEASPATSAEPSPPTPRPPAPRADGEPAFELGPGVAALAGSLPLDGDAPLPGAPEPVLRYMPSLSPNDPIIAALTTVCGASTVSALTLMDSRWNGNEAFRAETDVGRFFIKLNRVEAASVFMSEAVGLVALEKTGALPVPRPLHVGALPRVGDYGPGAFMILTYLELAPFGANRPDVQRALATGLAALHNDTSHAELHRGRYGFSTNNFHSLTPQDNRWVDDWPSFFARRLASQVGGVYKEKSYGRAPVPVSDDTLLVRGRELVRLVKGGRWFEGVADTLRPSLLHGALWIGNAGAVAGPGTRPVVFDPACYFGHSEAELALCRLYGGLGEDTFWDVYHEGVPRAPGFDARAKLYDLHERLNQLNLFGDPAVKAECEALMEQLLADA